MVNNRLSLSKKERLKSRKAIDALFKEGKRFSVNGFRITWRLGNEAEEKSVLQIGVGVSTRNFKKAVDRNRVKRLTREAWRLQKNQLKDLLHHQQKQMHVFIIYTANELPDFDFVKNRVYEIIQKLSKQV